MSEDTEITREIWEGKIPIVFRLSSDEVTSDEPPEAYYLLAPRSSYLTLITDVVRQHFQASSIPDCEDEMWFDFKDEPLKWHYPIGVLFDLYGNPSELPWALTVHFQFYPEEKILHCQDIDCVETHFISMVKEADYLRYRSTKRTASLLKREQKQLWDSLVKSLFEPFWAINRRLALHSDNEPIKYIPFRLYIPGQPVVQEPFSPMTVLSDGSPHEKTLHDLLVEIIPEIFETESASGAAGGESSSSGGEMEQQKQPRLKARVVIHGISPSLETPMIWLSENMSHPDNFLHICILPPEESVL
eukprot:Nk52_evm1s1791 gene=Nk52_evmTU1s1791